MGAEIERQAHASRALCTRRFRRDALGIGGRFGGGSKVCRSGTGLTHKLAGGSALALVSRNGPRLACASRRGLRSEERCIAAHLRIKGPPIAMDEAAPSFTQAGVARSGFAQGF
jgi:hypothetical protein